VNRQDSTTAQINDVARWVAEAGLSEAAKWMKGGCHGEVPDGEFMAACHIAVKQGCYDAHDWMMDRRGSALAGKR